MYRSAERLGTMVANATQTTPAMAIHPERWTLVIPAMAWLGKQSHYKVSWHEQCIVSILYRVLKHDP